MQAKSNFLTMLIFCFLVGTSLHCSAQHARARPRRALPARFNAGFTCTIYYTPIEGGFNAAAGFDVGQTQTINVNGTNHTYQSQFLSRVRIEGIGQLTTPVGGMGFIAFNGAYSFIAGPPVGNHNNALTPRQSCAADQTILAFGSSIRADDASIRTAFGTDTFSIDDVGGAIYGHHLDLYWGVANPRSAALVSMPAGTNFVGANNVPVTVLR